MRFGLPVVCVAVSCSLLFAGCGPKIGTVSGSITIDGQPLETGTIQFAPAEVNGGEPVTTDVKQGKYELKIVTGKKNVQISAPVVVEKRPAHDGLGAEILEFTAERLPARYNTETELLFEVQPGANTKDWSVQGVSGTGS